MADAAAAAAQAAAIEQIKLALAEKDPLRASQYLTGAACVFLVSLPSTE